MKNYILLISLFIYSFVFSQNLELDKKNGFKTIKLGTSMNSFENLKELPNSNKDIIDTIYMTSDEDLQYLFNHKIHAINLSFDKTSKKLIGIRLIIVVKKPLTDLKVLNKFKAIADDIIAVYGNPNHVTEKTMILSWIGNHTALSVYLTPVGEITLGKDDELEGTTNIDVFFFTKDKYLGLMKSGI